MLSALNFGKATVAPRAAVAMNAWNPQKVQVPYSVAEYNTERPPYLDGTLVGDVGFDPMALTAYSFPVFMEKGTNLFGDFSPEFRKSVMLDLTKEEQQAAVSWMRDAELKHGRFAMLAAAGWPLSELTNWGFLHSYGDLNGRAPSLFNGGLFDVYGGFFFVFVAAAAALELKAIETDDIVAGDFKFDPLGLASDPAAKKELQLKELKNGRLAMMAITGFAVQEFIWGKPVVEQTGAFFGRF